MIQPSIKSASAIDHENHELTEAACRLFTGVERGHLHRFQFSTSLWTGDPVRGAQLWADLLRHDPAYVFAGDETSLVAEVAGLIADNAEPVAEFLDLGPGSLEAFRAKSMPLIRAVQPSIYRPLDLCESFLADIVAASARDMPQMQVQPEHKDFLLDFVDSAHGPACLFWSGGGFSNIGTSDNEVPLAEIRSRFNRMQRFMPQGGRALISFDTGGNRTRHMASYDHPAFGDFMLNVLYRIARDCPSILFDPTAWRYEPLWNADNHVVEHHIVATGPQVIYLPDQIVDVQRGDRFVIDHSFKFPASLILRIAKAAGWSSAVMLGKGDMRMLALSLSA